MGITKRIDRAVQWAGEKMGGEARTTLSDEFQTLENEITLRNDGMGRLQKSTNVYVKWITRRCDAFEDKERNTPAAFFGRAMTVHSEDFEPDSEFGNCLASMGAANERVAALQNGFAESISATWLDSVERSVTIIKEYSAARKRLENRRLAYDASLTKMDKARRDDYRIEEEVRLNRAKFEESSEDVFRRMQDIKEAEDENVSALSSFLDAQLDYHERAAEVLRQSRQSWTSTGMAGAESSPRSLRRPTRSRSNTARSWNEPLHGALFEEAEENAASAPIRLPMRPSVARPPPPKPPRPSVRRASTYEGQIDVQPPRNSPHAPLTRTVTDMVSYGSRRGDIFADDMSTASGSGSGSPDWAGRSPSPATSYDSLSRTANTPGQRKAPPPPVNRTKKPPPPVPARRDRLGV